MRKVRILPLALAALLAFSQTAWAFCGFYVSTSSEPLVNRASRVVLVRDGERTSVTMESDVAGDPRQFAVVIPVPVVIRREQVRLIRTETIQHLADYTKPRIVEYNDEDPCAPPIDRSQMVMMSPPPTPAPVVGAAPSVRIEAQFSVGEYDIVVLSASDSGDLVRWLNRNGYRMPREAEPTVASYLRQNMFFFVAKVNMERMRRANPSGFLRPIQVDYDSPRFMLPIRLGTVNARGPQEMIVLALTRRGRIETTNYRTVKVPTDVEVPVFVREEFGPFYDALFDRAWESAGRNAVFLEYAWDLGSCDPCSAPPLRNAELRELGAAWVPEQGWRQEAFVTRLHLRYDARTFPEDLVLQETPDRQSFQARYVTRNAFRGPTACSAGQRYEASLVARHAAVFESVQRLTGWSPELIRHRMAGTGQQPR